MNVKRIFSLRKIIFKSILRSTMTGYLTVQQAADHLGITDARVRQFILAGVLPAERMGKKNLIVKTTDVAKLWDKRTKQKQRRQARKSKHSNGNGHK